jgi:2-hydroxychromene-2-carboxylate isomerase
LERFLIRGLAVLHQVIIVGNGNKLIYSFMRGVWSEGVDGGPDSGLYLMASRAGIDKAAVDSALSSDTWRATAETNRAEMLSLGICGVPGFKFNDGPAYWGQDRL